MNTPRQGAARRATHRAAARPEQDVVPAPPQEAAAPADEAAPPGRIEIWPIDRLRPHPQQDAMFHDLEGPEFEDFVADIARQGILDPILVTPDGVVIDGHQRKRATERLGRTEVPVRVRYDLAGDQAAIDLAHLRANRARRQLDSYDQARLARREMELELGRRWSDFSEDEKERLYDRLGEHYGYSRRHVLRLMKILGTPMAVQRAVSRKWLTMVQAERVYQLGWTKQEQIAREIEEGGDPAEVVASYLPKSTRRARPEAAFQGLVDALVRGLDTLEDREEGIRRTVAQMRSDLEVFERLEGFLKVVVPMLTNRLEESERPYAEPREPFGPGEPTGGRDADVA